MLIGIEGGRPWITKVWQDKTLLATLAFVESPWLDVSLYKQLYIAKATAGALSTHAFQVSWRDSAVDTDPADFIIPITLSDVLLADTNVKIASVIMPYVRFRVTNSGTGAFTSHCTRVTGVPVSGGG